MRAAGKTNEGIGLVSYPTPVFPSEVEGLYRAKSRLFGQLTKFSASLELVPRLRSGKTGVGALNSEGQAPQ